MAVSKLLFVLVIIFGSSSWMGTNSVWMQLPLLTQDLPEGWGLPSFLAAVVQIACIGPLVYTILHKCCRSVSVPRVPLITAFLALACFCQLSLAFAWWWTVPFGSREYSVALYLLLLGLALVNATSNVLFMPFMAQFHHAYLNAYFVGMGFSSLVPSILTLLQGVGKYECEGAVPRYFPPQFSSSFFFFVIFCWTIAATVSFVILSRRDEKDQRKNMELKNASNGAHEATPLRSNSKSAEGVRLTGEVKEDDTDVVVKEPASDPSSIRGGSYIVVLMATALVNAQMNGVIPSVQCYAALPYSQATYHYGIALANIVSPCMSFLPFLITIRSLPLLLTLTICSSCVTAFIIYLASLSPNLIFDSATIGSVLSIAGALTAAGLHSYLRVVFASLLNQGKQSESRLFWCGVFIQIGSFLGASIMFPLVNIFNIFTSAPPCR
uniref:Riboflavin transporter n=1 Tax=Haemonchus contortus TaxID=6289 RepID=A0A7I4YWV6_HAECO